MQGRIEDLPDQDARPTVRRVVGGRESRGSARSVYRRLYRWVALTDVSSAGVALVGAYWIRFGFGTPTADFLPLLVAAPLAMVPVFTAFHLYEAHRFTPAEEFRRIILAVSLGLTGVITLSFWSKADLSRAWLALAWGMSLVLALATRRLWHGRVGRLRARGVLSFQTLIVGTNDEARRLEEVMARPDFGFDAIGLVATGSWDARNDGLPVLGTVSDLRELIRETGAECVFVAASALSTAEMGSVAKVVRLEGVEVRVTATLPEVLSSRLSVQPLGGLMTLSLRPVRLSGTQAVAKRAFDLAVSGIFIVLLFPVLLTIALGVKATSSGSVMYRQRRVGQRGRPFTMLKFRTMHDGAEARVAELRDAHGVGDLMFKMRNDPRVTGFGRWLRRFSLD